MIDDQGEIHRLRELLDRYVSPSVASQAREQGIALGGELGNASAMFVDLYGFTALTQRLPAARVIDLLNEYYAIVERACAGEAGFIVQFLGDGVVIVFGGPLRPVDDHARRAVQAAVLLQGALAERNAGTDDERLDAGIGICTGEIIAGHVGTGERVTYTIVGAAVNQAARLQAKTRDCDASILLTESTRAAMGSPEDVPLRACGATMLKGLTTPVEIYAVELA
jgi:class 3 adenylate cyclase